MLAIRMQRTGRKGHAQYRVVVQDSAWAPTSGRVVYRLGSFNPHTKEVSINKDKTSYYLGNGAQPSPRVVRLLKAQKIKLPDWVEDPLEKKKEIKKKEKLRKNRPAEEKPAEAEKTEPAETEEAAESEAEETKEEKSEEAASEEQK